MPRIKEIVVTTGGHLLTPIVSIKADVLAGELPTAVAEYMRAKAEDVRRVFDADDRPANAAAAAEEQIRPSPPFDPDFAAGYNPDDYRH